ncbi:MAG: hypothetical protein CMO59_00820, partial [Verrucomicrobiales bacterium]|nr:hypothetical protein [Verrucomicrobiales bacterium]
MSNEQIEQQSNPLKKYYRQPKQFVKLPSNYRFYTEGSISVPESREVAVYPMTAKDEMMFKTPDALLNGQATVDVIQSCIPAIKDAWQMPSIDCDAALMSIRMATYGTKMTVPITVPKTKIEKDLELDLQTSLGGILAAEYKDTFLWENMEIKTKPLSYAEFTKSALKSFEQARLQATVVDTKLSDEEKIAQFNVSFQKLTQLNVDMVVQTIESIRVDGQTVTDKKQIKEFVDNTSKEFFGAIMEHLEENRKRFQLAPQKVTSTEEEVKQGAPETYEV